MRSEPTTHPADTLLRDFVQGKLDGTAVERVADHLEECAACRRRAADLPDDSFLAKVRDVHAQAKTPLPPAAAWRAADLPERGPPLPAATTPLPSNSLAELAQLPTHEIQRELGRGGMGVVYLARNKLMERSEVLKTVNKALVGRPEALERFMQEIRAAARLNHPNIATAFSALQLGELFVLAMEYVDGEDLAQIIKRRGALPIANACYYTYQAALGLQHACDMGMVHRDIKPGNLLLSRQNGRHIVKIVDFGLSKAVRERATALDRELTGSGQMMGTPDYSAPEQMRDARSADIRADIYSLGCTLYCLLTGRPPFTGNSAIDVVLAHQTIEAPRVDLLRRDAPTSLAKVVARMLAKDPAQRFQQPAEVAQALVPFIQRGGSRSESASLAFQSSTASEVVSSADLGELTSASTAERQSVAVAARASRRGRKLAWVAGAIAALCAGILGLFAAGAFRLKTPDGTIVIDNVPAGAEVLVEGHAATLTRNGSSVTVSAVPRGNHKLKVVQGATEIWTNDVTIRFDGELVHLEVETPRPPLPPRAEEPRPATPPRPAPAPSQDRKARGGSTAWTIDADALVHTDANVGNSRIFFGDPQWKDYDYSFDVTKTAGAFGVAAVFRAEDAGNFTLFDLAGWQNRKFAVECFVNGKQNWITFERPGAMRPNQRYRVLVKVRGDHFECYLDNKLIYDFRDQRHTRGAVGFRCWGGAVRISAIKVCSPDGKVLWDGMPTL